MNSLELLAGALQHFAGINQQQFLLSEGMWTSNEFKKGDFYNKRGNVCTHMSFIISGVFRAYVIDEKTGDEKNIFLYSSNGFVVAFKSFIQQVPCDYHTQALTDATVLSISLGDLLKLYSQSHQWERFGRLVAQEAFRLALSRTESFLFQKPEERYLQLIKEHPDIFNNVPLYHLSSYLGIQGPSLSRIRKRISGK